jgi:hypothetical protein
MRNLMVFLLVIGMTAMAYASGPVREPSTNIGKEIVAVTQQLQGMVGDFSKSQLGQLTYYSLLWKFLIKPIAVTVIGFMFLIVGDIILLRQWGKQWPLICAEKELENPGIILLFSTIGVNFAGIMMIV